MDNFDELIVDTDHFSIHIAEKVYEIWQGLRQLKPMDPEAFGVLVGNKDLEIERYGLVEITVPQKGDRCSRMSFTLRDPEHQRTVDRLYKNSEGQLIYFGTWHTHPEKDPHASYTDIRDWKNCKLRNPGQRLFFIIIGTEKNALYYFDNENILRQEF
ncbi:Mov34/MPN/PAD-1 family protein [Dickeya oryzae]|uniref:Mov34/MPN/PAD-1 family protein n=1 Tax=Dickeya oryzae TaxID=1240404 RepID=A0AB39IV63_9GAMM|nr:Mov34/MPN/PAD-1 family protein [Dickeya oryzae]MCA6991771.1 Mov34/MPN/PAD-1 family protein [Dickeya oryzae]